MHSHELDELRIQIDSADSELLRLLNRRAELSLKVGKYKASEGLSVFCPERERQLLEALKEKNSGPLSDEQLLAIYTEILSASRALQKPQLAACLGPVGTFSYLAGQEYLGKSATMQPQPNLEAVFASVADGKTQLGVVPLENSLQGSVGQSLDLFMHYQVHIAAEFFYRVRHSLLSLEERLAEVKKVYSHPQPLAQCAGWLKTSLPEAVLVTADSTAHAAKLARADRGSAAIGHVNLSGLFGLNVLAEDIEDQSDNWTRFVLIGKGKADEVRRTCDSPGKSTILFTLDNRPGALSAVLNVFHKHGLNLSKLESRPARDANWGYTFFADVEANLLEMQDVLDAMSSGCHLIKVLGVYPFGRQI